MDNTCDICGKSFETGRALSGHKTLHRRGIIDAAGKYIKTQPVAPAIQSAAQPPAPAPITPPAPSAPTPPRQASEPAAQSTVNNDPRNPEELRLWIEAIAASAAERKITAMADEAQAQAAAVPEEQPEPAPLPQPTPRQPAAAPGVQVQQRVAAPPPTGNSDLWANIANKALDMFDSYRKSKMAPSQPSVFEQLGQAAFSRYMGAMSLESGKAAGKQLGKNAADIVMQPPEMPMDFIDQVVRQEVPAHIETTLKNAARVQNENVELKKQMAAMAASSAPKEAPPQAEHEPPAAPTPPKPPHEPAPTPRPVHE